MDNILFGLGVPFAGTMLGSACVFIMTRRLQTVLKKGLNGFAAGVMVAASFWSLLIPALEMCESSASSALMRVLPALVGFLCGISFLLILDVCTPHKHISAKHSEGPRTRRISPTSKLLLALTIHNIPEGMAVGVALAAALDHSAYIQMAGAITLAVGIAIQNFPEGAIVSLPLRSQGNSKLKSFWLGTVVGAVEPVAAVATIAITDAVLPLLPYVLAFAAGSMMYVVVEELIPETQSGDSHSNLGTIGFAVGFAAMMVLDVAI